MKMTTLQRDALNYVKAIKARAEEPYSERRDSQYCVHGTYVGTWCGPDYMCGYCEDGANPYAVALMWAWDNAKERHNYYVRETLTPVLGRLVKTEAYKDMSKGEQGALMHAFVALIPFNG